MKMHSNPITAVLGACALIAIVTLGGVANGEERQAKATIAAVCGNEKVEAGETCDLGNAKNGKSGELCSNVCTFKSAKCGNGKIDEGETCDWGPNNGLKDQQCSAKCEYIPSQCGNKIIEIGEQCDDGDDAKAGDGCNKCRSPGCGDGYSDARLFEECDGGDGCTSKCCIMTGNYDGIDCSQGKKAR